MINAYQSIISQFKICKDNISCRKGARYVINSLVSLILCQKGKNALGCKTGHQRVWSIF